MTRPHLAHLAKRCTRIAVSRSLIIAEGLRFQFSIQHFIDFLLEIDYMLLMSSSRHISGP